MSKNFSNSKIIQYKAIPKILQKLELLKRSGELTENVKPYFQPSLECKKHEIEFTLVTTDYTEFLKMSEIFFESHL